MCRVQYFEFCENPHIFAKAQAFSYGTLYNYVKAEGVAVDMNHNASCVQMKSTHTGQYYRWQFNCECESYS
jgi:hypothetical protein